MIDDNNIYPMKDDFYLNKKRRSSLEGSDHEFEFLKPLISSRRDRILESRYAPDFSLSPCKQQANKTHGLFMDQDTFDEDVDFLFPTRERLPSITRMSSDYLNSSSEGRSINQMDYDEPSMPSVAGSFSISNKSNLQHQNIQDTCSLFDGLGSCRDSNEDSIDFIFSHLSPLLVKTSRIYEEEFNDTMSVDDAPSISREGKRK